VTIEEFPSFSQWPSLQYLGKWRLWRFPKFLISSIWEKSFGWIMFPHIKMAFSTFKMLLFLGKSFPIFLALSWFCMLLFFMKKLKMRLNRSHSTIWVSESEQECESLVNLRFYPQDWVIILVTNVRWRGKLVIDKDNMVLMVHNLYYSII